MQNNIDYQLHANKTSVRFCSDLATTIFIISFIIRHANQIVLKSLFKFGEIQVQSWNTFQVYFWRSVFVTVVNF